MNRQANTDHGVHELISKRWSPYGFSDKAVSTEDLKSLFEAARWASSSYNEQPWRYLLATREQPEAYNKLLSCLVEPNQQWAKKAPVLVLGLHTKSFARNGKDNRSAPHDLGQANAQLTFEATARGLALHMMAGILPERARDIYKLPEDVEVFVGLAIGYPDHSEHEFAERDGRERSRRPLSDFVFSEWGQAAL